MPNNPPRQKSGPPREVNESAEQLLGQMMFAIGAGADGVHIKREAVAKMRERYEDPTYAFVEKPDWPEIWQKVSIYTLRYFEVIGRLAARHATEDGTPAIDASHLESARVVVEATYRRQASGHPVEVDSVRGDICPPNPPPGPKTD